METEDKIMAAVGISFAILLLTFSIALGIGCYQSLTSENDIREKTINLNLKGEK